MNERSGRRLRRWRNNLAIHLLPNEGEREREKEKVRSMPLHRNAATCYSTSFLPPGEKFRGEGIGFVYAKRGTPCRDLGRRTMGVMEVTKEERANSNDRATIEPPPRSIGRRHWFPPVYQLHRSFLLFFFSSSSSSSSCFFSSYSMNEPRTRWGNSLYRGEVGGGGGERLPEIN